MVIVEKNQPCSLKGMNDVMLGTTRALLAASLAPILERAEKLYVLLRRDLYPQIDNTLLQSDINPEHG